MEYKLKKMIKESKEFTDKKLSEIRQKLEEALSKSKYKENITLITTGSYGRGEASSESDLDWFIIFDKDLDPSECIPDEIKSISNIISGAIKKNSGDSKTFGEEAIVKFSDMQKNIGGQNDTNANLTRRMLFILEGTWLYGESRFELYRKTLLEKYIKQNSSDQLPRFLLNDLIRYYRTIATDFEFKTEESRKSWGLRNIKLRYSRKLLYFSGLIVIAEISNKSRDEKITMANDLFKMKTIERINHIGKEHIETNKIIKNYENFLLEISQPETRLSLEKVKKENRFEDANYMKLRDSSQDFSKNLHDLLIKKYDQEHPIHHALVF